jgi:hypothetical protein
MSKSSITDHDAVDLSFRPLNYFWAHDLGVRTATEIQGTQRKALYEQSLREGEPMPQALLDPVLPEHLRQALGRIHPHYMGGEYLGRARNGEVVIARMTIRSTTADTYAIYARRSGSRLVYRAVDEYEGSSLGVKTKRSSARPLALGQLVRFAMEAWAVRECLEGNFADDGYPRDECQDFLMDLSSDFYPCFEAAIRFAVEDWLDVVAPAGFLE